MRSDELPNAAEEKRRALRDVVLRQVLAGKANVLERGASTVVKVSRGTPAGNGARASQVPDDQYVELSREKTDRIFVVLAEFGNQRHPSYPTLHAQQTGQAGYIRGQAPQPAFETAGTTGTRSFRPWA